MKKYILIFIFALIHGFTAGLQAQGIAVSGKVSDKNGQELVGVAVIETGTNHATVSAADGSYKLTVSGKNARLEFRMLGYIPQEITVGSRTAIDIILEEEALNINEVVVVGYGTQKRATVVGSISTADASAIQKTGTTNLTQAIGGRVSGVFTRNPGGRPGEDNANVYIRGTASYNSGANSPLVLVDGVEREYAQIDPEDIENFSVLKDASATAVYGVRGANGVILITTKRGLTSKPEVSFRASFTASTPTRLPDKLGSYDYARLRNEALMNVGLDPEYSAYDLEMFRTKASPYTHPDNDYIHDMLKNAAFKQQYSLVVRGGSSFMRYYVSAGYANDDGIYKNFNNGKYDTNVYFRRYALRANLDFNVTKTTTVGVDLAGRLEERHNNGAGDELFQHLVRTPPDYFNYVNPDGSIGGHLNLTNPYMALSRCGYFHSKTNKFESVIRLNQQLEFIIKGLSARGMFSYISSMRSRRDLYERPATYYYTKEGTYELVREEEPITIRTSSGNGPFRRDFVVEAALNYNRTFGDHAVTALLAFNRQEIQSDATLPIGYINYVGRVTYAYKNKYLAEFNAGYNGSMQFSKDKRYGFFPAVSAGWVLSEEGFWGKSAKAFSYMKLRASFGQVGNDRIGSDKYYYLQTYPQLGSNRPSFGETNNPENRIYEGKEGNTEVGWERANKFNVGVDLKFFDNKLSFTGDYFHERRHGILDYDGTISYIYGMMAPNDGSKGFPPANIGEVVNRGFEIDLGYNGLVNKFRYYIRGNLSFARNKVVECGESPVTYPWLSKVGRPIGQRFGLIADGFYNTEEEIDALPSGFTDRPKLGDIKYRDINGDGKTDNYDVVPIGRTQVPEIIYGFTVGGNWRNLDFELFFQGATNSDIYVNGYGYWEFQGISGAMHHHLGRWTPENKEHATYPSLSPSTSEQNHRFSTFWLKDGSYLRLKNIQIGYTLPQRISKKVGMSNLRFYVTATNLFTFSEFKEYDPESNDGDGSAYPVMKYFGGGVSLKF